MNRIFRCHNRELSLGDGTKIMGILNVTPDSFSDGGKYVKSDRILEHVQQLVEDGADMIDVGAESTRPGYQPVAPEMEWARLQEPILAIRSAWPDLWLSVDTQKAWVAYRALKAGIDIVNDIWGLSGDPEMIKVVAERRAGLIMMFNRTEPWAKGELQIQVMEQFFRDQIGRARQWGIHPDQIIVDPGLGFGYEVEDNWTVLRHLDTFAGYGSGLLLGPSRKRFLGAVTGRPPQGRDVATAAVSALAVFHQVDIVRVHNVAAAHDALQVADMWYRHA